MDRHRVPARQARQGRAFVRTKLKNVLSGKVVDKTFNAGVKVETANVDKRDMQYLYKDGADFVFMDTETYDQLNVPAGDRRRRAPTTCSRTRTPWSRSTRATPLYVELPASVELTITYTEPGLQGDRSTGGTKPATLETGAEIQVPLFITTGEKVKVDTRDGAYLGRVGLTRCPPAARPASARSTSSSRPSSAGSTRSSVLAERVEPAPSRRQRVHLDARRGRRRAPGPHRRADRRRTPRAGRSTACPPSTAILRLGDLRALWRPTSPTAVVDQTRRSAGQSCPPTSPAVRQRPAGPDRQLKPSLA